MSDWEPRTLDEYADAINTTLRVVVRCNEIQRGLECAEFHAKHVLRSRVALIDLNLGGSGPSARYEIAATYRAVSPGDTTEGTG